MQLMEERPHSFSSTTEGLLKKKKEEGTLFKIRAGLMNRSLRGVQIASAEEESSCSDALILTTLLLSKRRFLCVSCVNV